MFTAKEAREYLKQVDSCEYLLNKILGKIKDEIDFSKRNSITFLIDSKYIKFKGDVENKLIKLGYNVECFEKTRMVTEMIEKTNTYFRISF